MDRRRFLKSTGLVSTAMLLPRFLKAAPLTGMSNGRVLVVVQLTGGNDALNTVVPLNNDLYRTARPLLAIPPEKALRLTDAVGLNPGMSAMRALFDAGRMSIVQGVGYPDPDRSHFRSMDIWHTASGSDQYLDTGWLGRYMDVTAAKPHGVIEFGGVLSLANKGADVKAIALSEPGRFYAATREPYFARLAREQHALAHQQLGYLYRTMTETYQSAGYIQEKLQGHGTPAPYPKNALAAQLRHVAEFIRSGLETRVYYTSIAGFDTHVNQPGKHQRVLASVSDALGAFMADIQDAGRADDVLVMVFSEFGRRVKQNASNGTDHGTAGNVFLIGEKLARPGIFNELPSLAQLDANGDLKFTVDFRSIYVSVMERWLQQPAATVIQGAITPLPVLA